MMFDDEFGLFNENSLDLLLRFNSSNEEQEDCHSTDLFSCPSKDMPQTEDSLGQPFKDTQSEPRLA